MLKFIRSEWVCPQLLEEINVRDKIISRIDDNADKIKDLCLWIYEHPEVSAQEHGAARKISAFMRERGFSVEEQLCGMETAFVAVKKNGAGPKISFIAEYDALPGSGHSCGHHLITGMSVGAAIGLAAALESFPGTVALFGTPGEETGYGKPFLIERGAFDGVDAAMMIHPHALTSVCPEIITVGGIDFSFTGRAAHAGATPYRGVNALDAVVLLYNNVNALRQQLKDGTRIHGIILEAGDVANTIPDKGKVRLQFRAKELDYFEEVVAKVVRCAKAAALATGCGLAYEHCEPTCFGMSSNKRLAQLFKEQLDSFGIEENATQVMLGSSDIGNLSQILPSLHPLLKMTENGEELHTGDFLRASVKPFALERIALGAKILALTGLTLLESPELCEQLKAGTV